jgi:hypothetical protein
MARRQDIKAGRAYVSLYVRRSAFIKSLDAASRRLTAFGKSAQALGFAVGGAGALIVAAMGAAVRSFARTGDQLDKMSARTGVAAGSLAELGFAAEQSGTDLQTVEKGLFGLSRALFDAERGSAEAVDSLAEMGKTVEDFAGLDPEQQFQLAADGLASIEDASKRGAVAQKLFGRAGRQLLPMVENMRALRQEARDLGLVPSEEAVKDAAAVTDALNRVRRTIGAAFFEIGAAVAKPVLNALAAITNITAGVSKWVRENQQLVRTVGKIGLILTVAGGAIAAIGTAFVASGAIIAGLSTTITAVAGAFGLLFSSILPVVAPLVAVGAAIVGLTVGFQAFGQAAFDAGVRVRNAFAPLLQVVNDAIGGIVNALRAGDLELAGRIAVTGLRLAFLEGMLAIADLVNGQLGKMIASVGGKLAEGDIEGAWQDVVAALGTLWDSFASGIVSAMVKAANVVIDIWQKTVAEISAILLRQQGTIKGFVEFLVNQVPGLQAKGVFDQITKGVELDERDKAQSIFDALTGGAAVDGPAKRIADALLGPDLDPRDVAGAQAIAAEFTATTAQGIRDALAEVDKTAKDKAKASADAFGDRIASGADEAEDKVAALRAELAKLNTEAKTAAEKARKAPTETGPGAEGAEALRERRAGSATATFSAAGLIAAAGGGQSRMERLTERHIRKTEEVREVIDRYSGALVAGLLTPTGL